MASKKEEAARLIFPTNVVHNGALNTVKFLSSCFAGAVAGVLGLQNWKGFALFLLSTLFTGGIMYIVNCKGRPAKYVTGGVKELVNPGQDNVFSFVLVWTLFYGIVHGMAISVLYVIKWFNSWFTVPRQYTINPRKKPR